MKQTKRNARRSRHTGGKVAGGAVLLALLLAGGHFGLGIGREGGGLLTGESVQNAAETVTESVESAKETLTQAAETVQEVIQEVGAPQDDGVLSIAVKEDKLLYEGQEVTLVQLEEALLKDYKAGITTVELKDDHAIKATYDEVNALLSRLNIPFTTGQ